MALMGGGMSALSLMFRSGHWGMLSPVGLGGLSVLAILAGLIWFALPYVTRLEPTEGRPVCQGCGYHLIGLDRPACPECGQSIPKRWRGIPVDFQPAARWPVCIGCGRQLLGLNGATCDGCGLAIPEPWQRFNRPSSQAHQPEATSQHPTGAGHAGPSEAQPPDSPTPPRLEPPDADSQAQPLR
jgi:hypothetical protein